jgi:hypothetical protein
MEETKVQQRTSAYAVPGIPFPVKYHGKRTIIWAIAEAWSIPEEKVLGSTEVIEKQHQSPYSIPKMRVIAKGERQTEYVNARKFYFYVMTEIKHYKWKELTTISGRKIAAMKHSIKMAKIHMDQEPDYKERAQYVLDLIEQDLVIFPRPTFTIEAQSSVIDKPK